jgi:adenine specific DNA methylase Mod
MKEKIQKQEIYNKAEDLIRTKITNKGERHPTSILQYAEDHENIYIFKKEGGTYNPQKTEGKPYNKTNTGNQFKSGAYGDIDRATFREGEQNRAINKGERHPHSILQYAEDHENIYVFKKEQGTYNPQKTPREKDYKHSGKRSSETHYGNVTECKKMYKKEDGMHPTTILKFKNPSKSLHRTQKPTDLLEWLIKSYSNEGDTIMDFTMGSGSTGIACMNTKRKFIGIEMDKDIFTIAKERFREKENC